MLNCSNRGTSRQTPHRMQGYTSFLANFYFSTLGLYVQTEIINEKRKSNVYHGFLPTGLQREIALENN